ncbi:MAG TPA: alpha/beta hydrolase [Dongiaceae bacterium]|nr:alpha/beta hydrolase [Dongiaceae bacterium]
MRKKLLVFTFVLLLASTGLAQTDAASFAAEMMRYRVEANIVYHTANNYQNKLDVYMPAAAPGPTPVVVVIHGGGWVEGTKEERVLEMMPYLQMGFAAVNVEYRLGRVSLAPAAVEDCRCALHWVFANAKRYNFDASRVVLQGGSAGGHLALMTGMLTPAAGFDRECRTPDEDYWSANPGTSKDPRVAAIVNWFGIADVLDELHGPNAKGYAVAWLGDQPNADEIAKRVSPIHYVTSDMPPIITIHGDNDALVPYEQSVRLHKELDAAKVPNRLYTVPGANHGGFTYEQNQKAWEAIRQFLKEHVKGFERRAVAGSTSHRNI